DKVARTARDNTVRNMRFICLLLSVIQKGIVTAGSDFFFSTNKVRLRTYPQHTLSMLPLLRSRPGGVHKTTVVRSPKSDEPLKHCRLPNANCRLVFRFFELSNLKDFS